MSASDVTAANAAKPLPEAWRTPLELTLLGAVWGGSFLFMRVAAADFGAFALVDVRSKDEAIELSQRFWRIIGNGAGYIQQVYGPE